MSKLQNIFLIGPMGSGKTTVGRILANELKYKFYDSDKIIEIKAGADINWIFDVEGEEGFRKRETQAIEELTAQNEVVIATGGGSVLSPYNRSLLVSRGVVIYLKVSIEHQIARIGVTKDRPLLLGGKGARDSLESLQAEREPIYIELADMVIVTDDASPRTVVQEILANLEELLNGKKALT